MYRAIVLTNKGEYLSKNFKTKDEVDTWILELDEKDGLKRFRIMDKETKKIIETEEGVRNDK